MPRDRPRQRGQWGKRKRIREKIGDEFFRDLSLLFRDFLFLSSSLLSLTLSFSCDSSLRVVRKHSMGESPMVTGLLPSELLSFHLPPNDLRERTGNPDQDDLNPVPSPSVATSNGQLWWCPFSFSTCRRGEATGAPCLRRLNDKRRRPDL